MRNTKELVHAPRELGDRFKRYTERVCFRKRSINSSKLVREVKRTLNLSCSATRTLKSTLCLLSRASNIRRGVSL